MTKQKIAVVVSGFGDNKPHEIIRDLESRGFTVMYFTGTYLGLLPPVEEIDLALGHSAGATRVELEYGNNKSDVRVISLDSPTRFGDPNVVEYHSNVLDPISVAGFIISPEKTHADTFASLGIHDKNEAYHNVEWGE